MKIIFVIKKHLCEKYFRNKKGFHHRILFEQVIPRFIGVKRFEQRKQYDFIDLAQIIYTLSKKKQFAEKKNFLESNFIDIAQV